MFPENVRPTGLRLFLAHLLGGFLLAGMLTGCPEDPPPVTNRGRGPSAPAPAVEERPAIEIDGDAADWSGQALIWEDGGTVVEDPGFSVDIRQVFIRNDDRNLYFFFRCIPSITERFKEHPLVGGFGTLYFDTDHDRDTGTTDTEVDAFGYGSGYEFKVRFELGLVQFPSVGKAPVAGQTLERYRPDAVPGAAGAMAPVPYAGQARRGPLWTPVQGGAQVSNQEGARIAFGDDGLESALPLEMLEIRPGRTVRVMLVEDANEFRGEGYSVGTYTLR